MWSILPETNRGKLVEYIVEGIYGSYCFHEHSGFTTYHIEILCKVYSSISGLKHDITWLYNEEKMCCYRKQRDLCNSPSLIIWIKSDFTFRKVNYLSTNVRLTKLDFRRKEISSSVSLFHTTNSLCTTRQTESCWTTEHLGRLWSTKAFLKQRTTTTWL